MTTPAADLVWPQRPEFAAMPPALRAAAQARRYAAGAALFKLGEVPQRMFYVARGEVRLGRCSPDGGEIVLQRARDTFLAEASIESPVYHCDAIAAEEAAVLAFPMAAFRLALAECPEFRNRWMSHLLREMRRSRAQCERLALRGAAARVLHYIDSEGVAGRVVLPPTRKAWAAELGLTHEALYRTLARLTREGKVAVDGQVARRLPGKPAAA